MLQAQMPMQGWAELLCLAHSALHATPWFLGTWNKDAPKK